MKNPKITTITLYSTGEDTQGAGHYTLTGDNGAQTTELLPGVVIGIMQALMINADLLAELSTKARAKAGIPDPISSEGTPNAH